MKRLWKTLLGGMLVLAMSAPALAKDHGRGGDHDRWQRHERHEDRRDTNYRAYRRAHWNDHDRDDRRAAGWDHGRKTGWGGRDLPPGQAKKHGDWDRDDWARHHRRHHRREVRYGRNSGPVVIPTQPRQVPHQTQAGRGPIPVPNRTTTASTQKPTGHGPIVVPR